MAIYQQTTGTPNGLTADLAAVFAGLTPANIGGSQPIVAYGNLRVFMLNGYTIDITGSGLPTTNSGGAPAFTGTINNLRFGVDGAPASGPSFTISLNSPISFADFMANPLAIFDGDDGLTGWFGSNALYGYGGNDVLDGGPDGPVAGVQDTLYGGEGDDRFIITETVFQSEANSVIFGGNGVDTIFYNWYNVEQTAVLNMQRLTTQPTSIERIEFYATDFSGVPTFAKVTALPGAGLLAIAGLTEISGLKQIQATGAGTIDLSGVAMTNEGGNFRYYGTSGNDAFLAPRSFTPGTDVQYFGDGGNDTLGGFADVVENLFGGMGDDTYLAGAGDYIQEESDQGNDTVQSRISANLNSFVNIENLTLVGTAAVDATGNAGTNVITGNAGGNYLTGGGGTDTLQGAGGNDTYLMGTGVTIIEALNAGTDTALSFATATLATNVERLILLGDGAINGTGNALANRITGNDAANRIDGGALADRLIGGEGDDTYVFGLGDVIVEYADEGTDTVESAVTVTLAANLERLVLTGALAINGTGNADANRITGNAMANVLDGGDGIDTLIGGLGNDTYLVDDAGDVVTEAAGGTTDTVRASVSYVLAASANIDVLAAASGTVAINLTGNALAQSVTGNGGANVLNGGAGIDTLTGGSGADTFVFSAALAATGLDVITDFSRALDIIHLQNGIFLGIGAAGALASGAFASNTTGLAGDTGDRIIYETDTGILRYDSNGSSAGGTIVQFARLQTPLALDFTDFMVI
jgi:Ca2+-binding RTX toxin-like protein